MLGARVRRRQPAAYATTDASPAANAGGVSTITPRTKTATDSAEGGWHTIDSSRTLSGGAANFVELAAMDGDLDSVDPCNYWGRMLTPAPAVYDESVGADLHATRVVYRDSNLEVHMVHIPFFHPDMDLILKWVHTVLRTILTLFWPGSIQIGHPSTKLLRIGP